MIGRAPRSLTALSLVPVLAACSAIGDVRREPPVRTSAPPRPVGTAPAPSPEADGVEVRRAALAIAGRYDRPYVEFTDPDHGWALFGSCGSRPPARNCPAVLYTTLDGGRSWSRVRHPRPLARDQQLHTAPGMAAIRVDREGWYTSTDGGANFPRTAGEPAVWRAAQGRFQVDEATGRVARWDGRRLVALAAQPSVPRVDTAGEGGGLLAAAGLDDDGWPYAAVSSDGGRSWRAGPLPSPGGEVIVVRVRTAPDGELWLVGERPDRTGLPALWRHRDGWVPVTAPQRPDRVGSVAPLGAGRVVVNGPEGPGLLVDGRYERLGWPVGPEHHLSVLPDGTVVARGPQDVLLGGGGGTDRRWVRVVVQDG
ncbi:hypothetical protein [Micromonospora psammae]|uniref:hypothetical protein n=1 Tax=Micromonospora sp. CPCC 205556 TaxID=3122398 RepID=UPI002FF1E15D